MPKIVLQQCTLSSFHTSIIDSHHGGATKATKIILAVSETSITISFCKSVLFPAVIEEENSLICTSKIPTCIIKRLLSL